MGYPLAGKNASVNHFLNLMLYYKAGLRVSSAAAANEMVREMPVATDFRITVCSPVF
jgi:uncharacterized protein (DUF169 family)